MGRGVLLELSSWWKHVGIEVDVGLTSDNVALLSLLRRQLQMDHVCVVRDHANLQLFVKQHPKDSLKTFISCNLHADSEKMKCAPDDSLRAFVGRAITLPFGKYTILAFSSAVTTPLTPSAVEILEQIESMICDRYRVYLNEAAKATYEIITTHAVLLSPLQTYLNIANRMADSIRSALTEMTLMLYKVENCKLYSCSASNALDYYCKRLQVVVENINTATDRLSTVARRYSEPDTKKYYLSCFQYRSEGFVDQVNEMLLEVSKLIPDHHLSWTFHLDAEVVDNSSGHRTFYQHLFFFLEGILLRWSDCCSSAHVSVSFDCEHSFHSSVDSQNRLELGYLMVRFQPEHVSQNSEEVKVAKSRSRQLVEMLGDFLRLTDHGARVEVLQAEKASGAGRGVCEGEGESVEAESYLIRLPCHFHLLTDPLLKQMMGLSVSSRSLSVYRGCTVAPLGWVDVGRSSGSRVYEQTFSVLTEAQSYRKSVILQNGISWKSHMAEVAVTNRSQPRDSNIHGVSWTSVGRLISSGRNWLSGIFGDSKVSIEVPTNNLMLSSDAQSKQTPETPRTVTGRHVSSSSSSSSSSYTNFLHLVVPGFLSRSPAVSPTGISL